MAKANLGTKRVCPETGRKFYDLEKDPIVSPYTGKEYALSFFEAEANITAPKPEEAKTDDVSEAPKTAETEEDDDVDLSDGPEIISLEEADAENDDGTDEEIPDIPDIPDVDIEDEAGDGDDNTFLEEEENDDLSDVIVNVEGEPEES